ncbi:MAG: proton-conducting transporter membrane subunit [Parvibaculum sp.]|uniref:proton-conducting transporter transmembrane domain-containing protein n=1 Tax=Parvibaculum sp. TaxID=2024848 RepID=UPI003C72BDFD
MTPSFALYLAVFLPLAATPLLAALDRWPNARDAVSVITAALAFGFAIVVLRGFLAGSAPELLLFEVMPGLPLSFEAEPIGIVFALLASGLWIAVAIYSIGYMRALEEAHQTRFAICFAISVGAALGIAFAGNLFTLFIFYEVLTLSTYPLVAHKETPEARAGARTYLAILLSSSIGFFLVAIIWTWTASGTLDFSPGGIVEGRVDPVWAPFLLALFAFGIGKAALMPFHRWLPAAMVAPAPVSALLHAVAVVKAGVFTMLKVGVYIFGVGFLSRTGASDWLVWAAAISLVVAALIALSKDDLKARLAYSTVSQLAYVTLGVALANQMGIIGGTMQMVTHAMAKITLFMCAGAIYVATKKTRVSELAGLGRRMPWTFAAFLIASLSIVGLPPLGGGWSKWFLLLAAADAKQLYMMGVLAIGSLLSLAYLLPVAGTALFMPPRQAKTLDGAPAEPVREPIAEAPLLCLVPILLTAGGCAALFFFGNEIYDFLLHVPLLPIATEATP